MKRSIKLMAVLPLFVLVGCTDNGTKEMSNSEAKAYVQEMKKEISKDSFSLPNKGMVVSDAVQSSNGTTVTISSETRFDKTEGSRYLYVYGKTFFGDSKIYYYEKDDKYYCCSTGFGMDSTIEYETEAEFKAEFDQYMEVEGYDEESLRKTITDSMDAIVKMYDEMENPSSNSDGTDYSYTIRLTKINDSSFKLEETAIASGSSIGNLTSSSVIEFENYLPKAISSHTTGTSQGIEIDMTITQTYTWGSVEYVYPETSK